MFEGLSTAGLIWIGMTVGIVAPLALLAAQERYAGSISPQSERIYERISIFGFLFLPLGGIALLLSGVTFEQGVWLSVLGLTAWGFLVGRFAMALALAIPATIIALFLSVPISINGESIGDMSGATFLLYFLGLPLLVVVFAGILWALGMLMVAVFGAD